MNSELTDYISKCDICSCYQSSQPKEPLICHEIADRPWQKVGVDVFTLDDTDYLCVVDHYSSYFEVDRLESKAEANIAKKLRKQFSVHGIPNQLISDNMPFNSQEFKDFAASYEFEVITSSPGCPQSNGKVKNTIKTAKNIMKKAKQAGTDVYLSLLDWRNTPTEGMSSSPAQRMFGRRTRTLLPTSSSLLKPKVQEDVKGKLIKQKSKQTKHYNRTSKELPLLQSGEIVRVAPKQGDRTEVVQSACWRTSWHSVVRGPDWRWQTVQKKSSTSSPVQGTIWPVGWNQTCRATSTKPDGHITHNSWTNHTQSHRSTSPKHPCWSTQASRAGDSVPKPGATSHNKANHSCDKEWTSLKGTTVLTGLCFSQIRTLEHYSWPSSLSLSHEVKVEVKRPLFVISVNSLLEFRDTDIIRFSPL